MKKVLIITIALMAVYLSACTPEQQAAVRAHWAWEASQQSRDCNQAVDRHWPGDKARAKRIVHRESRNNPSAQNSRSSAAGCMQLLSMHAHRFSAVGCSWAMRYNADCGIKAAAHLYREAGWSPWNV